MNKSIRLLVEGFFDDEIFNTDNDINSDIEDLGRYYDYRIGDIYYQNKNPYAICCGDKKYFKDNKPRFCLLDVSKKDLIWRTERKLVKKFGLVKKIGCFLLHTFNDFLHIDEDGYKNTQIIKNNYNISEFPAFEYCLNLGDNVYLPAIDELQILYLNEDKLGKYSIIGNYYWSSTQYSATSTWIINTYSHIVDYFHKNANNIRVCSFFHLD